MNMVKRLSTVFVSIVLLNGCTGIESTRTKHHDDACAMLSVNKDWFKASERAATKWGIPISVQLAVIKHESSFRHDAEAATSSALGYAQALDGTFEEYKQKTNNKNAKRTSYYDATDFIGWYFRQTTKALGHSAYDAETFYLAYHDGIGGYKRNTHLKKGWLVDKAKKLQSTANTYRLQINKCKLKR